MTKPDGPGGSWAEFVETRFVDDQRSAAPARREKPQSDLGATAMMPAVVDEPRVEPAYIAPAGQARPRSRIGRFTDSVAGLLAAGCLVLGVGLVVLMVVAPQTGGIGLEASTGPGWTRAGWHLGVGAAAEASRQLTRRRSWPIRLTTSAVVVIAVLSVLAFSWWSR